VIAEPAVPEIADGPEHLIAPDIELANARRAGHAVVPKILIARRGGVIRIGPVESILAGADLEEQRVPQDRFPPGLVQPWIEPLIERRIRGRENPGRAERGRDRKSV